MIGKAASPSAAWMALKKPAPGPRTVRYGGNTSCTEVRVGDTLIIIDCGTGMRELGIALTDEFKNRAIRGYIFIGHTHWDHIQGFPFFNPLYQARNRFNVHSARGAHHKSIERVLRGTMAWPALYLISAIGLAALQAILRAADGRAPQTQLVLRFDAVDNL